VTDRSPEPSRPRQLTRAIGRAAVLIAALTAAGRVIGFGRQLVFAHTVANSCLGSAYTTANLAPNIIYDIVLGGALAGIMVPVLAGPAERSAADPQAARDTRRISSALLTWTVLLLAPVSVILALAANPVISVLIPHLRGCAKAEAVAVGSSMLKVFALQILLYGLAVVLYGILQAHRKFTAPALAPVLSSLVVITAYLVFVPLGGTHTTRLAGLSSAAELTLSVGTTAGVAALVLTAVVPAVRLRLRLRPMLRFPGGVARRAGSLATVGIAALIAQDASLIVVTRLANGHGGSGAVVPAAHLFASHPAQARQLALALAAFAPGVVGYGLIACLSRVLLADGKNRVAAAAMAGGWLVVIMVDVVAVKMVTPRWVVPVLGLGNTAGLVVSGAALLAAVRRARGGAALHGTTRAAAAGLAGAMAGAATGAGVSAAVPVAGFFPNATVALLACCGAAIAFGTTAYALDGGDLRAVVARTKRKVMP